MLPDEVPVKGASAFAVILRARLPGSSNGSYSLINLASLASLGQSGLRLEDLEILLVHNYAKDVVDKDGHPVMDERNPTVQVVKPEGFGLPGGAVNNGETIRQALIAEVFEETGLFIEVNNLIVRDDTSRKDHVNYALIVDRCFDEVSRAEIMTLAGLERYQNPSGLAFIAGKLRAARYVENPVEGCTMIHSDDPDWGVEKPLWIPLLNVFKKGFRISGLFIYGGHIRRSRLILREANVTV